MAAESWRRDRPTWSFGRRSIHTREPWQRPSRVSSRTTGKCRRCGRRSKLRQEKMVAPSERGAHSLSNSAWQNDRNCVRYRPGALSPVIARVSTGPDAEPAASVMAGAAGSLIISRQPSADSSQPDVRGSTRRLPAASPQTASWYTRAAGRRTPRRACRIRRPHRNTSP